MSTILGNPITLGGGGSKVPDYTYTGNAEWYNEEKTILKLKTSGVLTLTKDCIADVFVVGGGASGASLSGSYGAGGGGGGGYTNTKRVQFKKTTEYAAIIGSGGASVNNAEGNDGGETSINGVSANGGKGKASKGHGGGAGGSGGGASNSSSSYSGAGGTDGSDGGEGRASQVNNPGGTGQGTTTRAFGEATGELFSGGGGGGCANTTLTNPGGEGGGGDGCCGSRTAAKNGVENTGGGGGGGLSGISTDSKYSGAGGSGVILIRFAS